jgi:hypothetical protein
LRKEEEMRGRIQLEDIHNTRKIHAVMLGGRLLDRPALDRMLAEVKSAAGSQP